MRIPNGGHVLVADGRKSLLLRNEGDAAHPRLVVEAKEAHQDPSDRELKSDAPGRAFASTGSARSSYDETDFHQQAEDRFAAATAEALNKRALAGGMKSLVVVAPPRTLGELRSHYHGELEKLLAGEVAKDLVGHPLPDIEKILAAQ